MKSFFQKPKTPDDFLPKPDDLQFQYTTTLSSNDCRATMKKMIDNKSQFWIALDQVFDETVFCTKNKVGRGIYVGDSGSGVVVNNTLVGIVSASLECGRGYPDIITNVYSYLGWIATQIEHMSEETYEYKPLHSDFDEWF